MTFTISEKTLPFDADRAISQITLSNGQLTIVVHDYGARIHQIYTPDRYGTFDNILLSKNNSETYANDEGYYGVICGPVAGRIAGATYGSISLEANEGKNNLHSGSYGWERQFWSYEIFEEEALKIVLSLEDKKSGIPGPICAQVTYELNGSSLKVTISAESPKATIFNPAWHPYFNLSGDKATIKNHYLQMTTNQVVEVDEENIPTGKLLDVRGTVYDFQKGVQLGEVLENHPQGFDNCFLFNAMSNQRMLNLSEPVSGRQLTCVTDRQAVVIYTATNPETLSVVNGRKMASNRGIAIEFQELPDLVHHPEWGRIALKSGERKSFSTLYTFSVNK